jgi:hypothetical protein
MPESCPSPRPHGFSQEERDSVGGEIEYSGSILSLKLQDIFISKPLRKSQLPEVLPSGLTFIFSQ